MKISAKLNLFFASIILFVFQSLSQPSGWQYKKEITIWNNQNNNSLTDYQIKVVFDHAAMVSAGKSKTVAEDIRFLDSDNSTNLNYWLESGINTSNCIAWVKVPSILGNSVKKIYLYYGNSNAAGQSVGEPTFIFFDHFEGNSLDLNKWYKRQGTGGTYSTSGSELTLLSGINTDIYLSAKNVYQDVGSQRVRTRIRMPDWGESGTLGDFRHTWWGLYYMSDYFHMSGNKDGFISYIDKGGASNYTVVPTDLYNPKDYLKMELLLVPNISAVSKVNENVVASYITNIPTSNMKPDFCAQHWYPTSLYTQAKIVCDWVFVAKYSANEPLITVQNETPITGLIAYYPFNGNTNDESGNGMNLSIAGTPNLIKDRFNNSNSAFSYNGTSDYLYRNRTTQLLPTSALTVSAWVYSDQIDGEEDVVLSTIDTPDYGGYQITLSRQKVYFVVRTPNQEEVKADFNNIKSKWAHIVGTYDGNYIKLYVNGSLLASNTLSSSIKYGTANSFRIGSNETPPGADRKLKGCIDDVRIYNRSLSDVEILSLFYENPLLSPDIPVLTSPVTSSTGVITNPTFSWNTANFASTYQLQVSTSTTFLSTVLDQSNITGTSYTLNGLLPNTTYYWRVRSNNYVGTSGWSNIWSFTTLSNSITSVTLSTPLNFATDVPQQSTISWNTVPAATEYLYQIAEDLNFTQIKAAHRTSDAFAKENLEQNKTYYWKVRAENSTTIGTWSDVWRFTTVANKPASPTLVSPSNNSTAKINYLNPSMTLVWNAATDASEYQVQVSEYANFSTLSTDKNGIKNTTYDAAVPKSAVKYYWRVRGINGTMLGDWSEIWSFNTNLVGIEKLGNMIPETYSLQQNYPNPFNPETVIEYLIPENSFVIIKVYDTFGKESDVLVNRTQSPGRYRITWKPKDLPSGVYYYKLQSGSYIETRKMLYIR
jgi:hypothetical protein